MKILPSQPQFLPNKGQEVTGLCVMGFGGEWKGEFLGAQDERPVLPVAASRLIKDFTGAPEF